MAGRLAIYVIPVLLVVIEWVLRAAGNLDTRTFVGPTIASVGIGFIIPFTRSLESRHDELSKDVVEELERLHFEARPKREISFTEWCWLIVIMAIGVWVWTLFESIKYPEQTLLGVPTYDLVGVVNYLIGIVMTEVKERL